LATKLLAGWNAGVLLYLVLIYSVARRGDIKHLRERAAEEDESALVLLLFSGLAAFVSLGAIVAELGGLTKGDWGQTASCVTLSIVTILLSWSFVHASFALHYAHEFYGEGRDRKIGGMTFPDDEEPDYWDFTYVAFTIGMCAQVSDVTVSSKSIRRTVLVHSVISFLFNAALLALTVNIAASAI